MHDHNPTVLSALDYARLQGLMSTLIGRRTALASLLRRKLGSVVILPTSNAEPDIVVAGRVVRFRINGIERDERELTWQAGPLADPSMLSLREPRGLALLGLSAGQSIAYGISDGRTEFLTVERVLEDEDRPMLPLPVEAAALLART